MPAVLVQQLLQPQHQLLRGGAIAGVEGHAPGDQIGHLLQIQTGYDGSRRASGDLSKGQRAAVRVAGM